MPRRHFHSFDALRFLAFAKVFLLHLPVTAFPAFNFFRAGGGTGVSFFFVLSGFLITYILLEEKERTGALDLRSFFLRRALRIWPLYYALLAFAYLTPTLLELFHLPSSPEGYTPRWFMSVFFVENYEMIRTGDHPNVSPLGVTWSLCVEEHFYLIWGLLVYVLPLRRLPVVGGALILLAFAARAFFAHRGWPTVDLLTNIDYFMWGALPAWLLVRKGAVLEKRVRSVPVLVQTFILLGVLAYVLLSANYPYQGQELLEPLVFGAGFSVLLFLILPADSPFRIGEAQVLSQLGRYTYGLYLLHTIVINLLVQAGKRQGWALDRPITAVLFVLACFGLTLLAALLSYRLLERPFLQLRHRLRSRSEVSGFTPAAGGEGSPT